MVARTGVLPWGRDEGNFTPFMRNYADFDGRTVGQSPEPQQRVKLSPQVVAIPTALQDAETFGDTHIPGWGRQQTLDPALGYPTENLPITNNPAVAQRHARGQYGTGRWQNIGQAPKDGTTFGFDYWERILIDPSVVALGNVVSDTIFNITIRNTFRRDDKSILTIANNAGAGITLDGAAPPANIAPLADKIYVVTVTTQGPPNISGTIDFTTTEYPLSVIITGTRIIIFPYPPQADIEEKLSWLTDVIRSADGSEQRHSLRNIPRQSVVYDINANNLPDINNIRNLFVDWTTRVFGVPLWWNERSLQADVTATDVTIYVRPGGLDYADFRVGGLAMIFQENDDGTRTIDTLQISSIVYSVASPESTQDSISFATPIQNNYDGDLATVVPVVPGILAQGASQRTPQAGDKSSFNLSFEMLDNEATVPEIDNAWYPELDDFDGNDTVVISDKNFMTSNTLQEAFEQKGQRIDFDLGQFQQLTQELRARRSTPHTWLIENVVFEWQLRGLLYYLKGKLRNVWVPTWREDFIVNTNIGNGATTIDVDNHGFAKYVAGGRPWAGVRLEKTDGSVSYHRIDSASEVDTTTERLTIDPVTSFAATVAEVERLDLMILARQSTDEPTITHAWHDAETNDMDASIQTVFIGDVQS